MEVHTSFSVPLKEVVEKDPVCVLLTGETGIRGLALIAGTGFRRRKELLKQK